MTITTRVMLHCDVGLKCTKEIARTVEGPGAAERIRRWAVDNGWGTWGQRDACPSCWKELHQPAHRRELAELGDAPKSGERINKFVEVAQRDADEEDLQRAIALRRGQNTDL